MIITKEQVFEEKGHLYAAYKGKKLMLITPCATPELVTQRDASSALALIQLAEGYTRFQMWDEENGTLTPVQIQAPEPQQGRIYSIPLRFDCDQTITVEAPDLRTAMLEAISNASITPKEMVENGIYQDQDSIRIWREGVEEIYSQEAASTDWDEIPQTGN